MWTNADTRTAKADTARLSGQNGVYGVPVRMQFPMPVLPQCTAPSGRHRRCDGRGRAFDVPEKRQGVLDGVAVTGGEPLLRQELPSLLEKIKALGYAVKLDTNGAFPERLEAIVQAGLADYVAMDVKNSPERYAQTTGISELDLAPIFKSVSFLLRGTVAYEFRTTAVAELHDDASFQKLGDWLAGAEHYFIQCFEPRETVLKTGLHAPSPEQLRHWAELVRPKIPNVALRGI